MSVTRDLQLDGYRGIVMIYIVCVIHVVNWLDYNIEPYNSFMLFEMPIIFFISGASLTFSGDKNFWQNLNNRLWRILVPYYIYAIVAIILLTLGSKLTTYNFELSKYSLGNIGRVVFALDIPQSPFLAHIWFIIPYLLVLCSFPFQKYAIRKMGGGKIYNH